jgi:argininosuccinate lyase
VSLSDSVTTGSSIMPQKRNPDMAELIRGRTSRAIANYMTLAGVMKGLPLGYNRDTQEDKPPLFDSLRKVRDSLTLVTLMLDTAVWNLEKMKSDVYGDFSTATDLADFMAAGGTPFRQAHELVGKIVKGCQARGIVLEELTPQSLAEIAPEVDESVLSVLSAQDSVNRRESLGGPGPGAMVAQIAHAKAIFAAPRFESIA